MLSFEKHSQSENIEFLNEILNHHGYNLSEPNSNSKTPLPDLWSGYKSNGKKVVCQIYDGHIAAQDKEVIDDIRAFKAYNPDEFVIVALGAISSSFQIFVHEMTKNNGGFLNISFYGLAELWGIVQNSPRLMDRALNNSFITEEQNLDPNSNLGSALNQSTTESFQGHNPGANSDIKKLLQGKKKELESKHSSYIKSPDFFFQKAKDVLHELQNYDINNEPLFKTKEELTRSQIDSSMQYESFVALKKSWDGRPKKVPPKEFHEILKKERPALLDLFLLVNRFISYVDYNAWNKAEFNKYNPPRVLAKSGANQTYLIDQFLEYAANGFRFPITKSKKTIQKAIEYLDTPSELFNIFSEKHKNLISETILGRIYSGYNFHQELKKFFDSLDFNVLIEENRTAFYARIIYSRELRILWDNRFAPNSSIDETEESIPETDPTEEINEDARNLKYYTSIRNDSAYSGKDHLEFQADIDAFASIIALEKMEPPLAIGLFGKWGTGKSFFMHKLQGTIKMLSQEQGFPIENGSVQPSELQKAELFCKGIAQIHFNAWSYMDANLWASLVSKIFEDLNIYLGGKTSSEQRINAVQKKLSNQLELSNEQRRALEIKRNQLAQNIGQLKERKKSLDKDIEDKLTEIRNSTRDKVIDSVRDKLNVSENLNITLSKIQVGDTNLSTLNPSKTLEELRSLRTFALQFFSFSRKDFRWIGLIVLFLIILIIEESFDLIPNFRLSEDMTLMILGFTSIIGKIHRSIANISPVYNEVMLIRDQYEEEVANELSKRNQEEKALELEIDQKQDESQQVEKMLILLKEEKSIIQHAMNNTLAQKALSSFITDRSKSSDYEKHLGLISIIRKDFETLSDLFYASRTEQRSSKNGISESKREEYAKVREDIEATGEQTLDRIVLYIDDLDRCSDDRVIEVLEAVHLLMAFPLFVVVVGVDPRWVKNALIKIYYLHFTGQLGKNDSNTNIIEGYSLEKINASDYLEKIFQVPFCLKPATDEGISNIINDLLMDGAEQHTLPKTAEGEVKMPDNGSIEDAVMDSIVMDEEIMEDMLSEEAMESINLDEEIMGEMMSNSSQSQIRKGKTLVDKDISRPLYVSPASLKIGQPEIDFLNALVPLLGNVPRTAKRFVNIYRIIRAHEYIKRGNMNHEDYKVIMFLLVLPVGVYKKNLSGTICPYRKSRPQTSYSKLYNARPGTKRSKHV